MLYLFDILKKEILVILFSMTPIIELRGAIPMGISLGLNPLHSMTISILGNIIIVPVLLKILQPIMAYFEKSKVFANTIGWVKRRSMKKAGIIKKYSIIGLFVFVALPIPTTGVWTGSVIASLLKLDFKKALISMSLGIITSGIIVTTISYGFISIF